MKSARTPHMIGGGGPGIKPQVAGGGIWEGDAATPPLHVVRRRLEAATAADFLLTERPHRVPRYSTGRTVSRTRCRTPYSQGYAHYPQPRGTHRWNFQTGWRRPEWGATFGILVKVGPARSLFTERSLIY